MDFLTDDMLKCLLEIRKEASKAGYQIARCDDREIVKFALNVLAANLDSAVEDDPMFGTPEVVEEPHDD